MRLQNKLIYGLLVLSLGSSPVLATRSATDIDSFTYMRLQSSVRAAALGDTFVALADDPSAALLNPAGLARLTKKALQFAHNTWLVNTSYSNLTYVYPLNNRNTLGLAMTYFDFGKITETTRANPGGTGRELVSSATEYTASYGFSPTDTFSYGLSMKLVQQSIYGNSDYGVTSNLGLLYDYSEDLRIGAAAQNIGSGLFSNLTVGVSSRVLNDATRLAGEIALASGNISAMRVGLEYIYSPMLAFRGGYSTSSVERAGGDITYGVGLEQYGVKIDYAYVPFEDLGSTHRIGFGFDLQEVLGRLKPAEPVPAEKTKLPEIEQPKIEKPAEQPSLLEPLAKDTEEVKKEPKKKKKKTKK